MFERKLQISISVHTLSHIVFSLSLAYQIVKPMLLRCVPLPRSKDT